jgi:uncharacterized protein YggE
LSGQNPVSREINGLTEAVGALRGGQTVDSGQAPGPHDQPMHSTLAVLAEQRQIRVVGEGLATGTPDRCVINAALNVMADSLANAVSQTSILSSQVLDALRTEGVELGVRWGR